MMSNQLIQLVPDFCPTLDFQADQLPATGTADINAFDLHRAHSLDKIRGFPLNADLIPHGKISLGHFYDDHLDLGEKVGYFTDRLAQRLSFTGRRFTPGDGNS
mgnify:CR=1 FL=1